MNYHPTPINVSITQFIITDKELALQLCGSVKKPEPAPVEQPPVEQPSVEPTTHS